MSSPVAGGALGLVWVLPFAGMLLSLALLPGLASAFWHKHYIAVAAFWAAAFAAPFAIVFGARPAVAVLAQSLLIDFLPFIILLSTLYVVAGGIRLTGTIHGTPAVNTLLLLIGTILANVMGTTGAAMLTLRPLIRANRRRRRNAHVFVFFIFLVANIGGALTPLGNPPLLIGFLNGVPFLWPTLHLLLPTVIGVAILLAAFYALDRHFHRRHGVEPGAIEEIERLGIDGKRNLPLMALIPAIVFTTGVLRAWAPILALAAGSLALVGIAGASLRLTRPATHRANEFSAAPMIEVAAVFAAIFATVAPALAIVRAGPNGALAPMIPLITGRWADAGYFWLTGILSSLLDSAPAFLVFLNFAGGDAAVLAGPAAHTLVAISAGAVFMGAATYVGNAPNLMVKAICEERGIRMPGFLPYMGWAAVVLLPLYLLLTMIFFTR